MTAYVLTVDGDLAPSTDLDVCRAILAAAQEITGLEARVRPAIDLTTGDLRALAQAIAVLLAVEPMVRDLIDPASQLSDADRHQLRVLREKIGGAL